LKGNVKLEIKPDLDTDFPVKVSVNRIEYNRKKKMGTAAGKVHIDYGESFASSDDLSFELFPDEQNIKTLSLIGGARVFYVRDNKNSDGIKEKSTVFYSGSIREMEADRIEFQMFKDSAEIHTVESQGNSKLKIYSGEDNFAIIKGRNIRVMFDKEGEIIEFDAVDDAEIQYNSSREEENWAIKGYRVGRKRKGDYFRVTGEGGSEAEMTLSDRKILGGEIFIYLDSNNIMARNGVKIIINPKKGEDNPVGFFSAKNPVFITAEIMRFFKEKNRFIFTGNVKAWQEKKMLQAERIEFFKETGVVIGESDVKSAFPYKRKEKEEEKRLDISADEFKYNPEKHFMLFQKRENECILNINEANLRASSFGVYLKKESGDIGKIIAKEEVIIGWMQYEGRGNTAVCFLGEEKIELKGNPVLEEKNKGKTKGYKLTFFLADDKIAVENRNRERSITEIKS
jgi:lipopolysaccharide export system protein LptA